MNYTSTHSEFDSLWTRCILNFFVQQDVILHIFLQESIKNRKSIYIKVGGKNFLTTAEEK